MRAFFRKRVDGIDLFVRLTPKSSRDHIDGVEIAADGQSYLKARVRAVPGGGAANAALEKLVASAVGFPKSAVTLVSGGTSRLKMLRLSGDPGELARKLEEIGSG